MSWMPSFISECTLQILLSADDPCVKYQCVSVSLLVSAYLFNAVVVLTERLFATKSFHLPRTHEYRAGAGYARSGRVPGTRPMPVMPEPTNVPVPVTPVPVAPVPTAAPVLGAPSTPPVLGAPTPAPVLGAPSTPPVLGAPTTPPVLGAPTTPPVLGAPTAPPGVVPPPLPTIGTNVFCIRIKDI